MNRHRTSTLQDYALCLRDCRGQIRTLDDTAIRIIASAGTYPAWGTRAAEIGGPRLPCYLQGGRLRSAPRRERNESRAGTGIGPLIASAQEPVSSGRAGIRAESRMSPIVGPVLIRQRTIRGPLSKQFRGLGMQDCNIVIIEIESPFARFQRYAKKLWNCATLKYHARRRVFLTTVEKMVNTKILWIGLEISCRPHDVGWLF